MIDFFSRSLNGKKKKKREKKREGMNDLSYLFFYLPLKKSFFFKLS